MARAGLCVAKYVLTELSKLLKQPLIFVRETIGNIRQQLLSIGEIYLFCLNQKNMPSLFGRQKPKTPWHILERCVVQFEKDRHRQTIQTHTQQKQNHTNTNPNTNKTYLKTSICGN